MSQTNLQRRGRTMGSQFKTQQNIHEPGKNTFEDWLLRYVRWGKLGGKLYQIEQFCPQQHECVHAVLPSESFDHKANWRCGKTFSHPTMWLGVGLQVKAQLAKLAGQVYWCDNWGSCLRQLIGKQSQTTLYPQYIALLQIQVNNQFPVHLYQPDFLRWQKD